MSIYIYGRDTNYQLLSADEYAKRAHYQKYPQIDASQLHAAMITSKGVRLYDRNNRVLWVRVNARGIFQINARKGQAAQTFQSYTEFWDTLKTML